MKKILVPVDFSRNSAVALRYSDGLAQKCGSEILITHIYQGSKPNREIISLKMEEMLKFTLTSLKISDNSSLKDYISFKLTENTDFIKGMMTKELNQGIDLIVIGTRGASGIKGIFLGSNSHDLVQNTNLPVLVVPLNAEYNGVKRILYCSDFNPLESFQQLQLLKELASIYDAEVRIAHVKTNKDQHPSDEHVIESKKQDKFFGKEIKHSFKTIHSSNVLEGINFYIDMKSDIDLVCIINHKRKLFENLFRTDHTKSMTLQTELPLLIIPGK